MGVGRVPPYLGALALLQLQEPAMTVAELIAILSHFPASAAVFVSSSDECLVDIKAVVFDAEDEPEFVVIHREENQ